LKRPGGASRISAAEKEAVRRKQQERQEQQLRDAQRETSARGTHDVVRAHYNTVPERGREWRKTSSTIRGLRSFNNWVKSAVIQKYSPDEDYLAAGGGSGGGGGGGRGEAMGGRWAQGLEGGGLERRRLKVLDIGCGKGGDLGKWQQAPQPVALYVGVDPAEVSIEQARERYRQMRRGGRPGGGGHRSARAFDAEFFVKDAFGEWLGDIPLIREVGIDSAVNSRWGGGGFDVVSMMFCMHYAFESEEKARSMLRNVAGSLKKGGRLIGVVPNSDVLSERVVRYHEQRRAAAAARETQDATADERESKSPREEGEKKELPPKLEWGNSIYRVQFPGETPEDGVFRPPYGWKYTFFLEEAVEGVPEYVVPWEVFRAFVPCPSLFLSHT
jgi:mRNA (guanine-N7-)-methyltransferase